MVRVLVCGDLRGRVGALSEQISKLHAKLRPEQRFEAALCVGEFSTHAGEVLPEGCGQPPVPVYFIDAGPAAQELIEGAPQGKELSPNLHFLGHFGVATVAGLKVAFLSGRAHAELFTAEGDGLPAEEDDADDEDGQAAAAAAASGGGLLDKYGVQGPDDGLVLRPQREGGERVGAAAAAAEPSWEELKAKEQRVAALRSQLFVRGRYTPLAVERLREEIADSGGVDLLLTSEWPTGCLRHVARAWPEEMENRRKVRAAAKQCSAAPVAELAAAAEAKYHVVGLGGVFWRRAPWRHERRGEVVQATGELRCGVCRMISLGAADGSRPGVAAAEPKVPSGPSASSASTAPAPDAAARPANAEKWIHGLDLDPSSLPAAADDATPCPWSQRPDHDAAARAAAAASGAGALARPDFATDDREERRRWMQRFGCLPAEMQRLSDKLAKEDAPKEKKEKHKSLYKVSEKEKKRRKTGGDGHLPFHAKERMSAKG